LIAKIIFGELGFESVIGIELGGSMHDFTFDAQNMF